ncbi:unnamed protein product [Ilex paraguariensis]|uniref:Core-2/I-branching beta-1,6-N-acetylglucosaminyltransferase family protein n=1 Tax=Ilex paraguariensis TaxID=185542 RepID=A0ABC8RM58_9AQUA
MMKRRPASSSLRHRLFLFGLKLVILLSAFLCLFALLRLHSLYKLQPARHRRYIHHFEGSPKIAFLFLVRENLPLDFLWHSFFQNGDVANFSIYVHSKPGFVFDKSTTRSTFFYGRQLRNSIRVAWGEPSMIEAETLLFEAAIDNPANQRFVLLSDSCVPLYNFSYVYSYLMSSPRSFVDSFVDVKELRYNPKMSPGIPEAKWRKGSQWIALIRRHAEVVVDDDVVLSLFKKFCKRRPLLDSSKGNVSLKQIEHNCIPDEHFVQTLLTLRGLEDELERRTLTYSLWNQSGVKMDTKSWHPVTFNYANAGQLQINKIKDIKHIDYKSENRTELCRTNSSLAPCFVFARKFSHGAAMRLLIDGVVGTYDLDALFDTPK